MDDDILHVKGCMMSITFVTHARKARTQAYESIEMKDKLERRYQQESISQRTTWRISSATLRGSGGFRQYRHKLKSIGKEVMQQPPNIEMIQTSKEVRSLVNSIR